MLDDSPVRCHLSALGNSSLSLTQSALGNFPFRLIVQLVKPGDNLLQAASQTHRQQLHNAIGFLNWILIIALQVFHQSALQRFRIRQNPDGDWDRG
jgi:hypothetical protein